MTKKSLFRRPSPILRDIIPGFRLEADGRKRNISLIISGARGVRELSENKICVLTRTDAICIEGDTLTVTVFEAGSIGVGGKISSISFAEKKRRGGI